MQTRSTYTPTQRYFLLFCLLNSLVFLLCSCGNESQNGSLSTSPEPGLQLQQRAIMNLLRLYREALMEEDIDRLQDLLPSPEAFSPPMACQQQNMPESSNSFMDAETFRQRLTRVFCTRSLTTVDIPSTTVHIAADNRSVSFLEVRTEENFFLPAQQLLVFRTTFQVDPDSPTDNGLRILRIRAARQQGPLIQLTLPGQIVAGIPARLEVRALDEALTLTTVEVTVLETETTATLMGSGDRLVGAFTPPGYGDPAPLQVRILDSTGVEMHLKFPYRLRLPDDAVVQEVPGIGPGFLAEAIALAPDGTVWIGGREPPLGGGTLYRIPPGDTEALFFGDFFPASADNPLPPEAFARVTDLIFDDLERLHVLISGPSTTATLTNGDFVSDPLLDPFFFCQTVNIASSTYPFHVRDPQTGNVLLSPSTQAVAADVGAIWLFGSSGGVARVHDSFREGECPDNAVDVVYDPLFRRQGSDLLSNTVLAFVVGADNALWFGTALGLTRWQEGQFTSVLFHRDSVTPSNAATLEAFFQEVATAIVAARPLATVGIGEVAFLTLFGAPLIKEDLIFSALEDTSGRLWAGTLGGGLRRIEAIGNTWQDTLHLTRQNGLGSNTILALAAGEEETIWAATDEGVSRIQDRDGTVSITNFSALHGLLTARMLEGGPTWLRGPVRDIALDNQGTLWVATDIGVFRIFSPGGTVRGMVQDTTGAPVAGVDVVLLETVFHLQTPFRTVTDATGHYTLANVPPGSFRLRIDGSLAAGEPLATVEHNVDIHAGEQTLDDMILELQ